MSSPLWNLVFEAEMLVSADCTIIKALIKKVNLEIIIEFNVFYSYFMKNFVKIKYKTF
jgi:hypothetical protein